MTRILLPVLIAIADQLDVEQPSWSADDGAALKPDPLQVAVDHTVLEVAESADHDKWLAYFLQGVDAELGEDALRDIQKMCAGRLRRGGW